MSVSIWLVKPLCAFTNQKARPRRFEGENANSAHALNPIRLSTPFLGKYFYNLDSDWPKKVDSM